MLRLVVGLLDYPVGAGAGGLVTFRPLPSVRALDGVPDVRLDPPARLVVGRVLGFELGGVSTVRALSDLVGAEAVVKAVALGYLAYNPMDLTMRLTARSMALLKALNKPS